MNFRQVSLMCLVVLGGLVACVTADEPLSMKMEMRHGRNGPKRSSLSAVPGERVNLCAQVRGLKANEQGQVKLSLQAQLRNEENDLLKAFGSREFEVGKCLGNGPLTVFPHVDIPLRFAGKKIRIVHLVRDQISGQEITHDFPIEIREPEGAYASDVAFSLGENGPEGSGRFTVGDSISVRFQLLGLESTKRVQCKVTVCPKGKVEPALELNHPIDVPQVRNIAEGLSFESYFTATEPFEGTIRLLITDDSGHSNSVELPVQVTETLGSEVPPSLVAKAAEKTADEAKKK